MVVLQCHSLFWWITPVFVAWPCVFISYLEVEVVLIRIGWGAQPRVCAPEVWTLAEEAVDVWWVRVLIEEVLDYAVLILRLMSIILIGALAGSLTLYYDSCRIARPMPWMPWLFRCSVLIKLLIWSNRRTINVKIVKFLCERILGRILHRVAARTSLWLGSYWRWHTSPSLSISYLIFIKMSSFFVLFKQNCK